MRLRLQFQIRLLEFQQGVKTSKLANGVPPFLGFTMRMSVSDELPMWRGASPIVQKHLKISFIRLSFSFLLFAL
ncbi:unnamed protein product [Victoria cruziana]